MAGYLFASNATSINPSAPHWSDNLLNPKSNANSLPKSPLLTGLKWSVLIGSMFYRKKSMLHRIYWPLMSCGFIATYCDDTQFDLQQLRPQVPLKNPIVKTDFLDDEEAETMLQKLHKNELEQDASYNFHIELRGLDAKQLEIELRKTPEAQLKCRLGIPPPTNVQAYWLLHLPNLPYHVTEYPDELAEIGLLPDLSTGELVYNLNITRPEDIQKFMKKFQEVNKDLFTPNDFLAHIRKITIKPIYLPSPTVETHTRTRKLIDDELSKATQAIEKANEYKQLAYFVKQLFREKDPFSQSVTEFLKSLPSKELKEYVDKISREAEAERIQRSKKRSPYAKAIMTPRRKPDPIPQPKPQTSASTSLAPPIPVPTIESPLVRKFLNEPMIRAIRGAGRCTRALKTYSIFQRMKNPLIEIDFPSEMAQESLTTIKHIITSQLRTNVASKRTAPVEKETETVSVKQQLVEKNEEEGETGTTEEKEVIDDDETETLSSDDSLEEADDAV